MTLPEPATAEGRAGLEALLADPAGALVALDFDGTLAPIVARPELAAPHPGARRALHDLAGLVGCAAVVSGRGAADVVRRGGLAGIPGLVVAGNYGLEVWRAGETTTPPPSAGIAAARRRLPALLADAPAGVHVEDKRHALVVHTRPTADPAGTLAVLRAPLDRLAGELGLEVVPGRLVLELRPPGVDKGLAVRRLAEEAAARSLLVAGDDVGDLTAFAAVRALRRAGLPGLVVVADDPAGAGEAPAEVRRAADLVLAGPAGVVAFLTELVDRLRAARR
jgi:trehalose 6-phosphate phosphatase